MFIFFLIYVILISKIKKEGGIYVTRIEGSNEGTV